MQAEILEHIRAAAAGRSCDLVQAAADGLLGAVKLLAQLGGRTVDGALQRQQRDGQALADLVVQFPGDALPFALLRGQRGRAARARSVSSRSSIALNVSIRWARSPLPRSSSRSLRRSRSTRRIEATSRPAGQAGAQQNALAARITARPTTSTGSSVSSTGEDTVAGESASTSVPSVKTRPLIRKSRRNSASPAGRARQPCSVPPAQWSRRAPYLSHPGRRSPPEMGTGTDGPRRTAAETGIGYNRPREERRGAYRPRHRTGPGRLHHLLTRRR